MKNFFSILSFFLELSPNRRKFVRFLIDAILFSSAVLTCSILFSEIFVVNVNENKNLIISSTIFGLTFLEAGQVYDNFREFNPFNSKRSMGFGLRIFMPAFGLLGIDFAYGLDNTNDANLSPNGWETHFVIGQQF